MKNREELLISRGSKDLLQFTKTRIAMSYTSWSPNSLSLSLARDLSQLVSLSQFQTQPKAHRFLLPSILNPKNHQIPLISKIENRARKKDSIYIARRLKFIHSKIQIGNKQKKERKKEKNEH